MNKIAIDLGGTRVRVCKADDKGNLSNIIIKESKALESKEIIIDNIVSIIKEFDLSDIDSIGICAPGPVDKNTNSLTMATNIPDLKDYNFCEIISNKVNKKVFLENDANAAGLAEAIYGAGKDYDIVYYLTHSTGIGGALIINKKIISGRKGFAGEVANVIVKNDGLKYNHLAIGAIENEASGTAIARIARELIDPNIKDASVVFKLYQENHPIAIKIIEQMSKDFAILLSNISAIVAPDCFVIGGGVSKNSDLYFDKVKKYYQEYVHELNKDTPILKAKLEEPGLIGASLLNE